MNKARLSKNKYFPDYLEKPLEWSIKTFNFIMLY